MEKIYSILQIISTIIGILVALLTIISLIIGISNGYAKIKERKEKRKKNTHSETESIDIKSEEKPQIEKETCFEKESIDIKSEEKSQEKETRFETESMEIKSEEKPQIKQDFPLKKEPLFFIYEMLLNGLSPEQNQYLMKGRLVSEDDVEFESMIFELPSGEWEGEPKYYCCENGKRKDSGTSLTFEARGSKINVLKGESENLNIGKRNSYDFEGNYVVDKKDGAYTYKSLKDNTYKSLRITLLGVGDKKEMIDNLKVIKCPNIRAPWLIFYIILSVFLLSTSVLSLIMFVKNGWNHILMDDFRMTIAFCGYFALIIIAIVFFTILLIECVFQYIVLIKMQKFGIPRKTKIVSDTLLFPKIIEYMTGSEKVDNLP